MTTPDLFAIIEEVAHAFEQLKVTYEIGGSVASSAYGMARSSLDVDIVADLRASHADPLVELLRQHYYIEADEIREAVRAQSSFNLIHLTTMFKVDIFILKTHPFHRQAMERRQPLPLTSETGRQVQFMTPEDVVLNKLTWFHQGGRVSERQRQDVVGIFKVQGPTLNMTYVKQWAKTLDVEDILEEMLQEAGLPPGG